MRVLSDSLGVFLDHREPFLPVDLIHMFVCFIKGIYLVEKLFHKICFHQVSN